MDEWLERPLLYKCKLDQTELNKLWFNDMRMLLNLLLYPLLYNQ